MNMKLLKITRTDTLVRFVHEVKTETGIEDRDHTAHEAPLAEFDQALANLAPVAAKVLELPPDYAVGISVHTLSLTYTKQGTRTATLTFKKQLDSTLSMHPMATPAFQIDDGGTGEDTRRQCTPKHAAAIVRMIEAAEAYANGSRQQMQLGLKDKPDPEGDGEPAKGKGKKDLTAPLQFKGAEAGE